MIQPNFSIVSKKIQDNLYEIILSPLPQGFGHTLGSVLRRTLLSSNSGVAASYVRIKGARHPFSTIDGIKESVLQILLNIKSVRFSAVGEGPWEVHIKEKGVRKITASAFDNGAVKPVNKTEHIAEVTDPKAVFEVDIILEKGVGYISAEEKEKKEEGYMAIDSLFSPVLHVQYKVEQTRVGRSSNYDKLILIITTDGTVDPDSVLRSSANTLKTFFSYIADGKDKEKALENTRDIKPVKQEVDARVYQTIIDELDLPTRVINALLREKIETVEDLIKRDKEELIKLKGVGKKSLDLIKNELDKLGVEFETEINET